MPKKKLAVKKITVKQAKPVKTSKVQKPKKSEPKKKAKTVAIKAKAKATEKQASMTPRENLIQDIKQKLLSQRDLLLKEAEETLNTLPSELNFPDMGDQATAETDRNFILRLRDRERLLLKKIEETIERIESRAYGMCEECGNEIGIKRLEARPVTTLCIDCKTRQEEEERISEGSSSS